MNRLRITVAQVNPFTVQEIHPLINDFHPGTIRGFAAFAEFSHFL
jgi:hypothetical protein